MASAAAAALMLTACAGSAGASGGSSETDSSAGFEHGASQDVADEAIDGLESVTLIYQSSAPSETAPLSSIALSLKEGIEKRSNGQITIDIVWGHAIAAVPEIDDALADGRIDLSHAVPTYSPSEYPGINALGNSLGGLSTSPFVGELVANSVALDLAWNSDQIFSEYQDKGLTPISPVYGNGYYAFCSDPGGAADDWAGRQVRIAGAAHTGQVNELGGSPVSMDYNETYEALQRGTVDCALTQLNAAEITGLSEVAPNVTYSAEAGFTRGMAATVAGSKFDTLPLPYQQIVFDYAVGDFAATMHAMFESGSSAIDAAIAAGGQFEQFDSVSEDSLRESGQAALEESIDSAVLGNDLDDRIQASIDKWTSRVDELGFEDSGELESFRDWYDYEESDFTELSEELFKEGAASRRPQ